MFKPLMASLIVLSSFGSAHASSLSFACAAFTEATSYTEAVPGESVELNFDAAKARIKQLIATDKKAEVKVSFSDNYPLSYSEVEVLVSSPCIKFDGPECNIFEYKTTVKYTTVQSKKTVTAVFTGDLADFPESFPEVKGIVEEGNRDESNEAIKSLSLLCRSVEY
jgi:cytochrome c-type biogenesis protein CcmE